MDILTLGEANSKYARTMRDPHEVAPRDGKMQGTFNKKTYFVN